MSKICKRCKKEKDEKEFKRNPKKPDGLRDTCEWCYHNNQIRSPKSDKWLEKIANSQKGKKRPEHSEKIKGRIKTPEEIEKRRQKIIGRKYSIDHRLAISKGQKRAVIEGRHPWKVNKIAHKDQERAHLEYKIWKEKVMEANGKKCKACGRTDRLHCHHIKSFYNFPELKFDPANGELLCISCHMRHHRLVGSNDEIL